MRMALIIASAMLALAGRPLAAQTTVAIACGSVGIEARLCREGAEAWGRATGHGVRLVSTPPRSTERLALFQQLLAAHSPDIDVFQLDVIWPGLLAGHLLDLTDRVPAAALEPHFPAIVRNNTVAGRLVAVPWITSAGLLYVRRDLLERHGQRVPETWEELAATARAVMAAEARPAERPLWGYVFQGRAYEGLTVNALEWVASHGGGGIVGDDGAITIDNPAAARALDTAAGWVGTIAPRGVLNYAEEDARGVFQAGDAVFMRNWPYAWPLLNAPDSPMRGRVAVAPLPRGMAGDQHAGVLGGEELGVSRYSRHPDIAVSLVLYLAGRKEQKRRAIAASFSPTIAALYDDAEVLVANPFLGMLRQSYASAVARPAARVGGRYNQVSAAFWSTVHGVLSAGGGAGAALPRLARRLERLRGADGW